MAFGGAEGARRGRREHAEARRQASGEQYAAMSTLLLETAETMLPWGGT